MEKDSNKENDDPIDNFRTLYYLQDLIGATSGAVLHKIDNNNIYLERNGERAYAKFDGNIFDYQITSKNNNLASSLESIILHCQSDILYSSATVAEQCLNVLGKVFKYINIIFIITSIVMVFMNKSKEFMFYIVPFAIMINILEFLFIKGLIDDAKRISKLGYIKDNRRMGKNENKDEEPVVFKE